MLASEWVINTTEPVSQDLMKPGVFIGPPKETQRFTVEQLTQCGLVGLYKLVRRPMTTEEFTKRLSDLILEYEGSNDNADCCVTFNSIEQIQDGSWEKREFVWHGLKFVLVEKPNEI